MIRRDYEGGLLLIPQTVHSWVSGQMALRWGNEQFFRPEPWEALTFTAAQHDNGWAEWELAPRIRADGRPVSFMEMALEEHFVIWQRSSERMQVTNLYGALLVSMHATDLYQRRLANDTRGDTPEMRSRIRDFIEEQRGFQTRLRETMADHPRYGPALAEDRLEDAFRLLQVWDWLSLLLLMGPVTSNMVEDVPVTSDKRISISLQARNQRTIVLDPFPFDQAPFPVRADGRWLAQRTFGHNALFRRALEEAQLIELEFWLDRER
jgi:hypothetical protein